MSKSNELHEIVANYREVAADLGRSPNRAEYLAHPLHKFTQHKIRTYFGTWIQLMRAAGSTPNRYANTSKVDLPEKLAPRILVVDIECAPMKGYFWGLWDQNIPINHIINHRYLLSYAAKWIGEEKVIYRDLRGSKNLENDRALAEDLAALFNQADIVVGQNSKRFDTRVVNARISKHRVKIPSTYKQGDTKLIAKKHFDLPSYSLEYMCEFFGLAFKKQKSRKYIGFDLWIACMANDPAAFAEMELYNKSDVLSTEALFKHLLPWGIGIDFNVYRTSTGFLCNCGSDKFTKAKDFHYTGTGAFEKYSCDSCGSWAMAKGALRNLLSGAKKGSLKGPQ